MNLLHRSFLLGFLALGMHAHAQYTSYDRSPPKTAPTTTISDAEKSMATQAYIAKLNAFCPKQHAQWLPAPQMDLLGQTFESTQLSPMQNGLFQQIVSVTCLHAPRSSGAACANIGLLVAARRGGYTDRVAVAVCRSGATCRAKNACRIP